MTVSCPFCAESIADDAPVCPHCGSVLRAAASASPSVRTRACAACAEMIPDDARDCPHCGTSTAPRAQNLETGGGSAPATLKAAREPRPASAPAPRGVPAGFSEPVAQTYLPTHAPATLSSEPTARQPARRRGPLALVLGVLLGLLAAGGGVVLFQLANRERDPEGNVPSSASPDPVPAGETAQPGDLGSPPATAASVGDPVPPQPSPMPPPPALEAPVDDEPTDYEPEFDGSWDTPLSPDSVGASRFLAEEGGYPPARAFDSRYETAWAVRDPRPGEEWIEARFATAAHVAHVRFTTGFEKTHRVNGDLFPLNAHLRRIRVETDSGSFVHEIESDEREADLTIGERTTRLRLVVLEVWPGERWQDLCLSEIALFGAR